MTSNKVSIIVGAKDNFKDLDGEGITSEMDDLIEDAKKSLEKIKCYKSNK